MSKDTTKIANRITYAKNGETFVVDYHENDPDLAFWAVMEWVTDSELNFEWNDASKVISEILHGAIEDGYLDG